MEGIMKTHWKKTEGPEGKEKNEKKKGPGQMSRDMHRTSNLTCISKRKNIERAKFGLVCWNGRSSGLMFATCIFQSFPGSIPTASIRIARTGIPNVWTQSELIVTVCICPFIYKNCHKPGRSTSVEWKIWKGKEKGETVKSLKHNQVRDEIATVMGGCQDACFDSTWAKQVRHTRHEVRQHVY